MALGLLSALRHPCQGSELERSAWTDLRGPVCCGFGVCVMGSAEFLDRMWKGAGGLLPVPTIPTHAELAHSCLGLRVERTEARSGSWMSRDLSLLLPVFKCEWN